MCVARLLIISTILPRIILILLPIWRCSGCVMRPSRAESLSGTHAEALSNRGIPARLRHSAFTFLRLLSPISQSLSRQLFLGGSIDFSTEIRSTASQPQRLLIDYVVHFKKANGLHMPKVFKWTTISLDVGGRRSLTRRHAIRPVTTRRYYDGQQHLMLRINGKDFGMNTFQLSME